MVTENYPKGKEGGILRGSCECCVWGYQEAWG